MSGRSQKVTNEIVAGFNELSDALKNGDDVVKKFTCRKIVLDLNPIPYSANDVKQVRSLLSASQSLFAHFIGVSASAVQRWEQGLTEPSDIACRFMDEIRINPSYWQERFAKSILVKNEPVS